MWEVKRLVFPVILNMGLTLFLWKYVYDMKVDEKLASVFYFDGNLTTGNPFKDGLLNAASSIALLACVSFGMLSLALLNLKVLVQFWLYASCLLVLFGGSAMITHDILSKFWLLDDWNHSCLLGAVSGFYGTIGALSFFTPWIPQIFHQIYVITNCSMVSLFYLRSLPGYTSWFILVGIVAWDIFAVLAPMGPLRKVQEKADDYSGEMLRFLMFTADRSTAGKDTTDQATAAVDSPSSSSTSEDTTSLPISSPVSSSSGSYYVKRDPNPSDLMYPSEDETCSSTSSSSTSASSAELYQDCIEGQDEQEKERVAIEDKSKAKVREPKKEDVSIAEKQKLYTVADALNDDNAQHLGLGDFVFYSVLVGAAATNGSCLATLAACVGVVFGLVITLSWLSTPEDTVPALPVPVLIGIVLHFWVLYFEGRIDHHVDDVALWMAESFGSK